MYFKLEKGVRRGDPVTAYLLILGDTFHVNKTQQKY